MTIRSDELSDMAGTGPITLTGQWAGRSFLLYDQVNVSIRSSGNVSSVTDVSNGKHTVAFTNAFAGFDYAVVYGTRTNRALGRDSILVSATSYTSDHRGFNGTLADNEDNHHLVVGELAS